MHRPEPAPPDPALSQCAGCWRATETIFGRCPQCGYAKDPEGIPYKESYMARGPGPDSGVWGPLALALVPGAAMAALGFYVFDSLAIAALGLVIGPIVTRVLFVLLAE